MNRYSPFLLIFLSFFTFILVTGFQCGSTEMTSAKLYMQRQEWNKAEEALQKEVDKNPQNGEAWYLLGRTQLFQSKYEQMLNSYDKSLASSNSHEGDIRTEKLSVWQTLVNSAAQTFNSMNKAPADSMEILSAKTLGYYKLAIRCNPDSALTYENMAIYFHRLGNYDEQVANLRKVMEITKNDSISKDIVIAYRNKADKETEQKDTTAAKKSYTMALTETDKALQKFPDDNELLEMKINLLLTLGKAQDAIPDLRKAVQNDPTDKISQYNLALLLLQSGNFSESAQHFEAAINIDNSYADAYRNLGVVYLRWGQQMKDDAEANAKVDPKTKDKVVDKSYVEKFKKSAEYLDKLTKMVPDDIKIWNALATAYGNAQMFKEAKKALDEVDRLSKKQ